MAFPFMMKTLSAPKNLRDHRHDRIEILVLARSISFKTNRCNSVNNAAALSAVLCIVLTRCTP
jgi:hypothetical protein